MADDPERVGDWVSAYLDLPGFVPPYSAIGWVDAEDEMIGGVVFNNFTGPNVEASVAWNGPLVRSVLRHVRRYVFDQEQCRRLTIHTRAGNASVIEQAQRMGFAIEGRHPALYADDDGVSLGILRQNCRW